jgi:hypothetical protein
LKLTSLAPSAAVVALFATALFAATTVAQPPQAPQEGEPGGPPHHYPMPKNLKVLPKTTNGEQIRKIMHGWAGSLGVHCDTCHQEDAHNLGPDGKPRLDFPSDAKQTKLTARRMYKMVQGINAKYISTLKTQQGDPAKPVTCGTCHRGHLDPEPYVIPPEHRPGGGPSTRGN